jgi:sugar phosphate isomerase/epimerase
MTLNKSIINVTTASMKNLSGYEASKIFIDNGLFDIELSAGIYLNDQINKIKRIIKGNFLIHNYFPPPKKPFVLNIASLNDEIYRMSFDHIIKSIQYSVELNSRIYSFHPGFVVDIDPKEIGVKTTSKFFSKRRECLDIALTRINDISKYAKKYGIEILLENNVMKKTSFDYLKKDTTILSNPKEIKFIMENTDNNVNLLLDVAHLKVSSKVLKFDLIKGLKLINPWVKAYHLSDNDGYNDNNQCFNNNSWFVKLLKKDVLFYTIEVYSEDLKIIKSQVDLLNSVIM